MRLMDLSCKVHRVLVEVVVSLLAICFGSAYKKELTARAGSLSTHTDFGL